MPKDERKELKWIHKSTSKAISQPSTTARSTGINGIECLSK